MLKLRFWENSQNINAKDAIVAKERKGDEGLETRDLKTIGLAGPCPLCAAPACGGFLADFGGAVAPK